MSAMDKVHSHSEQRTAAGLTTGSSRPARSLIGSLRKTDAALRSGDLYGTRKHGHGWAFDLVWLVYSVFFFIEPVQRNNRSYWMQFVAVYAVFLALYVGIIRAKSRRMAYAFLAALGLLGILYYPQNLGAPGMMIYVVAFAPFITDSLTVCISIFVAVSACLMGEGLLLHLNPWSWGFPMFICLAVGSGNLVAAQRMRTNQKLSLAHEEIAHLAKVAERERIARDLHDVLGHTLSVVVLKSELAGKLMEQNRERAYKEIAEVEQIARSALAEVRQAISGYRSEGLMAELNRARVTLDAAGVTLECTAEPPKLRLAEETVLSLIVREAVTNIVRHAHASRCRITLLADTSGTAMFVEDNGRGGIPYEGNGLRGMRERVESLGGRLQIESAEGTRLVIEVPA